MSRTPRIELRVKIYYARRGLEVCFGIGNWKFFNLPTFSEVLLLHGFCRSGGASSTGKDALWWVRRHLKSKIKYEISLVQKFHFGGYLCHSGAAAIARSTYSEVMVIVEGQTRHNVINEIVNVFIWHFLVFELRNDSEMISTDFSPFLRLKVCFSLPKLNLA